MKKLLFFMLIFSGLNLKLHAQDLVYKAKNPAFGGETFNYQWLQSSAQAQNPYSAPRTTSTTTSSTSNINTFSENLNRQLLNNLARQIADAQFGESTLNEGSYAIGNFLVDVSNGTDGIVVDIIDQSTEQSTQVIVPFY